MPYTALKLMSIGEKRLWQACIRQHIQDLFLPNTSKRNKKLKKEAQDFLFHKNNEYIIICGYAGYHPIELRKRIQKLYLDKIEKNESLIRKVFKNHAA